MVLVSILWDADGVFRMLLPRRSEGSRGIAQEASVAVFCAGHCESEVGVGVDVAHARHLGLLFGGVIVLEDAQGVDLEVADWHRAVGRAELAGERDGVTDRVREA